MICNINFITLREKNQRSGNLNSYLCRLSIATFMMTYVFDIGCREQELMLIVMIIDKEHEIACQLSLKNAKIVLLIGSTGAGKSTTIYFLNGVEMEQDSSIIKHIRVTKRATIKKELSNVKLAQSHRTSVTSHIAPVPMIVDNEKIIFCNTPGFGDSRGDEIDISNSFGLINAMSLSKCVRIIFLISQDDTALRMTQLKIMADHFVQYLSNYKSKNSNDSNNTHYQTKYTYYDIYLYWYYIVLIIISLFVACNCCCLVEERILKRKKSKSRKKELSSILIEFVSLHYPCAKSLCDCWNISNHNIITCTMF